MEYLKKILLITDPQAMPLLCWSQPQEIEVGIYECIINKAKVNECILKTKSPNLDYYQQIQPIHRARTC